MHSFTYVIYQGSREQVFIREGEEPADFWENVGAAEYPKYFIYRYIS